CEERYILNQFRERRKKSEEDYPPRSKRRYHKRDHAAVNQRLIDDYFSNQPTYDDTMFRRRFRMRKHVFLRIVEDLSRSDDYFTQRFDAANKEGISPLAKCTTSMRMLAYGMAAEAVDEYIKIGGTTALECLRRFCKGIIQLYEQVYLRAPTEDDLQRILHVSEMRGFPGMIGSIDCMHWEWKNCPKAWEGQLNDINVLDRSPVFGSCIILHNMIVEDERDTYAQLWTDYDQSEASGSNAPQPFSTEVLPSFANHVRARSELWDSNVHHELQTDLVKHIWQKFSMFRG
ncbi:PREDICTED: uncharacterized protein LOC106338491, partial [Brassica oleracea var. oleracea]|uniref:uncharacterized protein LOC106338491 n=1 Tax=Brassica oleracea var. oleracea TaxID=109376 RepID=UPI0006A711A2